jgi:hypothetical protein
LRGEPVRGTTGEKTGNLIGACAGAGRGMGFVAMLGFFGLLAFCTGREPGFARGRGRGGVRVLSTLKGRWVGRFVGIRTGLNRGLGAGLKFVLVLVNAALTGTGQVPQVAVPAATSVATFA